MNTLTVVARWRTQVESVEAVLALVDELRTHSLAEPGCEGYEVLQAADDPAAIFLVERYRDQAALDAHRDAAHFRDLLVARILPLLTDRRVEVLHARK